MNREIYQSYFKDFPSEEAFDEAPTKVSALPIHEGEGRGFQAPDVRRWYPTRREAMDDIKSPVNPWSGPWLVTVDTEIDRTHEGPGKCGVYLTFVVRHDRMTRIPNPAWGGLHDPNWLWSWRSPLWQEVVDAVVVEMRRRAKRLPQALPLARTLAAWAKPPRRQALSASAWDEARALLDNSSNDKWNRADIVVEAAVPWRRIALAYEAHVLKKEARERMKQTRPL